MGKITLTYVWMHISELPVELYTQDLLFLIASCIGRPYKVDDNTFWTTRGYFVRISVEVDFIKAVISKIMVDGKLLNVEYENITSICFRCGRIGHRIKLCQLPEVALESIPMACQNGEAQET